MNHLFHTEIYQTQHKNDPKKKRNNVSNRKRTSGEENTDQKKYLQGSNEQIFRANTRKNSRMYHKIELNIAQAFKDR